MPILITEVGDNFPVWKLEIKKATRGQIHAPEVDRSYIGIIDEHLPATPSLTETISFSSNNII